MSGPVTAADAIAEAESSVAEPAVLEVTESRASHVGAFPVRRALPRRTRRTLSAWCFVDHMGPATVDERGLGVAPHPHIGLQTVTWLLAGEALHRGSLGTEQVIAPGQLNLMTAGQRRLPFRGGHRSLQSRPARSPALGRPAFADPRRRVALDTVCTTSLAGGESITFAMNVNIWDVVDDLRTIIETRSENRSCTAG